MRQGDGSSGAADPDPIAEEQYEEIVRKSVRLGALAVALALGAISGLGLFVATIWLVIKGGDPVGPHLSLLNQYLPGYSVTVAGSFIGLGWGFAAGMGAGCLLSFVYNLVGERRGHRP